MWEHAPARVEKSLENSIYCCFHWFHSQSHVLWTQTKRALSSRGFHVIGCVFLKKARISFSFSIFTFPFFLFFIFLYLLEKKKMVFVICEWKDWNSWTFGLLKNLDTWICIRTVQTELTGPTWWEHVFWTVLMVSQ